MQKLPAAGPEAFSVLDLSLLDLSLLDLSLLDLSLLDLSLLDLSLLDLSLLDLSLPIYSYLPRTSHRLVEIGEGVGVR